MLISEQDHKTRKDVYIRYFLHIYNDLQLNYHPDDLDRIIKKNTDKKKEYFDLIYRDYKGKNRFYDLPSKSMIACIDLIFESMKRYNLIRQIWDRNKKMRTDLEFDELMRERFNIK